MATALIVPLNVTVEGEALVWRQGKRTGKMDPANLYKITHAKTAKVRYERGENPILVVQVGKNIYRLDGRAVLYMQLLVKNGNTASLTTWKVRRHERRARTCPNVGPENAIAWVQAMAYHKPFFPNRPKVLLLAAPRELSKLINATPKKCGRLKSTSKSRGKGTQSK